MKVSHLVSPFPACPLTASSSRMALATPTQTAIPLVAITAASWRQRRPAVVLQQPVRTAVSPWVCARKPLAAVVSHACPRCRAWSAHSLTSAHHPAPAPLQKALGEQALSCCGVVCFPHSRARPACVLLSTTSVTAAGLPVPSLRHLPGSTPHQRAPLCLHSTSHQLAAPATLDSGQGHCAAACLSAPTSQPHVCSRQQQGHP